MNWATVKQLLVIGMIISAASILPSVLAQSGPTGSSNETQFGEQVTVVMQSSAVDLQNEVNSGMWNASVAQSNAPDQVIEKRISRLRDRLQTLQNTSQTLSANRRNGSAVGIEYTAKAVRLRAQIAGLKSAMNDTLDVAANHGVDSAKLQELRQAAGSIDGPEIAGIAQTLTDGGRGPVTPGSGGAPPNDTSGGPGKADGSGPPDQTADNRSEAAPGNSSAPADKPN